MVDIFGTESLVACSGLPSSSRGLGRRQASLQRAALAGGPRLHLLRSLLLNSLGPPDRLRTCVSSLLVSHALSRSAPWKASSGLSLVPAAITPCASESSLFCYCLRVWLEPVCWDCSSVFSGIKRVFRFLPVCALSLHACFSVHLASVFPSTCSSDVQSPQ